MQLTEEESFMLSVRCSLDIQVEMLIGYMNLEFREEVEPEDRNLEFVDIRMVFEAMRLDLGSEFK